MAEPASPPPPHPGVLDYAPRPAFTRKRWVQLAIVLGAFSTAIVYVLVTRARPASPPRIAGAFVPLQVALPKPAYYSGPMRGRVPPGIRLPTSPRPPLMVPPGTKLLSRGAPVTSSDSEPVIGMMSMLTDGEKGCEDSTLVEIARGVQWVQIDLAQQHRLYAIALWHSHATPHVVRDVVVQVSDDPAFATDVKTLFNSDADNSAGRGAGIDAEYIESYQGLLVNARGIRARYVRLYSAADGPEEANQYVEVEVYGLP